MLAKIIRVKALQKLAKSLDEKENSKILNPPSRPQFVLVCLRLFCILLLYIVAIISEIKNKTSRRVTICKARYLIFTLFWIGASPRITLKVYSILKSTLHVYIVKSSLNCY
jgi:hypothetical protein